jgi:hypothetical protein
LSTAPATAGTTAHYGIRLTSSRLTRVTGVIVFALCRLGDDLGWKKSMAIVALGDRQRRVPRRPAEVAISLRRAGLRR